MNQTNDHRMWNLSEINAPHLAELADKDAIVILPISPIEEHGPHLPMGTDAMNAEYFAQMAAELVLESDPKRPVIIAPTIPLGTNVYRFMGSINIRQRVIRDLVIDYGRSLRQGGFRHLIIVSAHGGPGHLVALDEAATTLTRRHGIASINLTSTLIYRFLTGKMWDRIAAALPRKLSDEEQKALSMDYHGGWWETAMMLHLRPDLVDPSYRDLPDALVPRWRLRRKSPLRPPAGQGYLGAPSRADAEFALVSIQVLRDEARQIVDDFLSGNAPLSRFRSPLYWVPILRTDFRLWVIAAIVIALVVTWIWVR